MLSKDSLEGSSGTLLSSRCVRSGKWSLTAARTCPPGTKEISSTTHASSGMLPYRWSGHFELGPSVPSMARFRTVDSRWWYFGWSSSPCVGCRHSGFSSFDYTLDYFISELNVVPSSNVSFFHCKAEWGTPFHFIGSVWPFIAMGPLCQFCQLGRMLCQVFHVPWTHNGLGTLRPDHR